MTSIDDIFLCASQWLQDCVTNHQKCQVKRNFSKLPQRLIYLGGYDKATTQEVQLIHNDGTIFDYCALSYCWGTETDNFGITTTQNLAHRETAFSIRDLPQTIRDAIDICKHLGLSYLWVDSICIKQDDLEDWRVESPIMNQIYGNAFLTLTGVASEHANEGLFNPRWLANRGRWFPSEPDFIQFQDPSGLITDPWARLDQRVCSLLATRISTRAWTLQEELMSMRNLFWTRHGLIWSCLTRVRREWVDNECQQQVRDYGHLSKSAVYYPKFLERRHATFINMQVSPDIARKAWMDALSSYLRRRISRSEDRLVAIGGLVKILQKQLQDKYVAGLWLQRIPEDLLWGKVSHLPHDVALRREPSWSWASLPADCTADAWLGHNFDDVTIPACTVQDVQIDPPDAGICGPLHSGRLRLLAQKKPFLSRNVREWDSWLGPTFVGPECYIAVDLDVSDSPCDSFWDRLECVKILEFLGREFCLLVEPADQKSGHDTFRRVGRAEIYSKKHAVRLVPVLHVPERDALAWVENTDELYSEEIREDKYFQNCDPYTFELI
jgi:hypothetical protein